MNERIQELIVQAQKEVWGNNPYNGSPEFEGYELDAEKFSELILKECLKYIDDSFGDIDYVKFMIKRNFGVEE